MSWNVPNEHWWNHFQMARNHLEDFIKVRNNEDRLNRPSSVNDQKALRELGKRLNVQFSL